MISFWLLGYVLAILLAVNAAQHILPATLDGSSSSPVASSLTTVCGGYLNATRGIIQTPNFPNKFPVPIDCTWIIDASNIRRGNTSIVVYFTQQYVLRGLKFTEYDYLAGGFTVPSQNPVFELNEEAVTQISWVRFHSDFLKIEFRMESLYGTHLRALDRLLDIYGFNITYEIDVVKPYQCSALLCRYLGHCYASANFTSYYCSCFPGFSGDDCGLGPLCRDGDKNFCENGGVCKQVGDTGVTCLCPSGFKGKKCQIPDNTEYIGCKSDDKECDSHCQFEGHQHNICKCTQNPIVSNRERARYETEIRLSNSTAFGIDNGSDRRRINDNIPVLLEKQINRALPNLNVSKINGLREFQMTDLTTDRAFYFFGMKSDESRIREVLKKIVERGRLGNVSVVPTLFAFRQQPALQIQSVTVNYKTAVRQDAEFILSCNAQGSPSIVFHWYKNGIYLNITKATRKIWSRLYEDSELKDHYTALLGVPKASRLDEGIYTCQVSDWGVQQCRSTAVHILARPELRLDPPSATIYRGESLRIRCLSSDTDQGYGTLGYSWTKNNALFQSDAENEMWEDLYPDGSILKIKNIQKSANYTCVSSNSVGQVSKSVYVYVVDRGTVELCGNESTFGVNWPASSPGPPILSECPKRYEGQSQRICEQRDFGKPTWLTPNFSECLADSLVDVYNEFRGLTFGYQKTNGSAVLKSCLEYAMNRHTDFLPGEAGFLLKLLQEVDEYLTVKGSHAEQEIASDIILQILDIVLKSEYSLNNQEQVKKLQALVQSATLKRELYSSATVPVSAPSTSLQYHQASSFWVHKEHIKALPFRSQIYGDHLFSDQFYTDVTPAVQDILTNGSLMLSVIAYKNLTNFLPKMYFDRNSHDTDTDYMTASRVIASWLVYANQTFNDVVIPSSKLLHLPLEMAHVEIIFQHENPPNAEWMPVCGYDLQATYESTWRTDLCITENLMLNVTRCICPLSGTFIVLLAKKTNNTSPIHVSSRPMFIIVSCGCCFLQSCIAFAILIPILYNRKCSVTFLKMQFCTATSTAMAIFTLGFAKLLPSDWYGLIASSLGGILLLGSSTLIGIALIVDSELGPRKSPTSNLSSGMRGAIGLSWFMPILYTIATPLIYSVIGSWPSYWWLAVNTMDFILFVIIEVLFVILFLLLFCTVLRKLMYLAKKHDKHNVSIRKRIGLIYRTAILLLLKLSTDSLYMIYLNTDEFIYSYIFGAFSVCLGFAILLCFVVKAEVKLKTDSIGKNTKHSIEDFCSGSINSPLNFYTNHDIEKENDCAPSSMTTKLPLAITTPRCQLDRLQTNLVDPFINGGLCETAFLEMNNPSASLDSSYIDFQQPVSSVCCYDMEIQRATDLYGCSYKPIQGKCFLSDTNDFVGVCSLDILQGVRQDSIIGIRSNSKMGESNVKDLQPANLLHTTTVIHNGIVDTRTEKSPRKSAATSSFAKSVNADVGSVTGTAATAVFTPSKPPIITITTTEEEKPTIDGMLDRISHDLDYLLNRTSEIPTQARRSTPTVSGINNKKSADTTLPAPQSPISSAGGATTASDMADDTVPPAPLPALAIAPLSSHPNLSVREVIREEDED